MLGKLIKNEFIKLMKKPKTKVMIVLYIIFVMLIGVAVYKDAKSNEKFTKPELMLERLNKEKEDTIKNKEDVLKQDNLDEKMRSSIAAKYDSQIEEIESNIKDIDNRKNPDYWKIKLKSSIENNKNSIESGIMNDGDKDILQKTNDKYKYQIDNNIKPEDQADFNGINYLSIIMTVLGNIFLVVALAVFASDTVSGECTPATLKFLLVQPVKRSKILLSKFITVSIVSVALIVGVELIAFLGSGLALGFGQIDMPTLYGTKYIMGVDTKGMALQAIAGTTHMTSALNIQLWSLGLQALFIVATVAVVFMISTLVKSSMISMAVSSILLIIFPVLTQVVTYIRKMAHVLFFSYGNPTPIITGDLAMQYSNVHLTVNNCIIALICTTIVAYIIAHINFVKKDFTI